MGVDSVVLVLAIVRVNATPFICDSNSTNKVLISAVSRRETKRIRTKDVPHVEIVDEYKGRQVPMLAEAQI